MAEPTQPAEQQDGAIPLDAPASTVLDTASDNYLDSRFQERGRERHPGEVALGVVALGSLVLLAVLGLWVAPPDAIQGDAQRIMYVHVPAAILAYVAFGLTSLGSALYLWKRTRHRRWDRLASVSAELGVLFTGLTLILGMLWGRPVWGVYWTWDARLVTTAILFFLYLGYLALRRVIDDPDVRAKRSAVAALVAFVDVPVVHYSVEWWRSLHQESTLFPGDRLDPQIEGDMLVALLWGIAAFAVTYAYLMVRRYRLARLEEGLEDRLFDAAIAERRAEADLALASAEGSA